MADNEMKKNDTVENNAEMINVYLPEQHQNIPARKTESVDDINYKFNLLNGKKPKDFIAMVPFRQPDLSEVKSVVFDRNSKQSEKKEGSYHKKTWEELGEEKIIQSLNQLGGKKRGKNYVVPFFKGFGDAVYNIGSTVYSGLKFMGEDAGAALFNAINDANVDLNEEQQRSIDQFWASQNAIREKLGLNLGKYDSRFSADLGGSLGSMLVSLGAAATYKSPNAAAMVFGMSKTGDVYTKLREKGTPVGESLAVAVGSGVVEGGIEKIGLSRFFGTYGSCVLKRKGNAIKTILKQGKIEFLQEGSQSFAGNFLMAPYEEGYQWREWVDQAMYEGVLAAITAPVAGAATYGITGELRAKYADIYQEKLGLDEQQSKNLAELTVLDQEEALDVITEIADNETIATLFNDNAVDDAEQTLKEGQDILDKLLEQKAMGLSDEVQARVDELQENIKQQALDNGLEENEAEAAGALAGNIVRSAAVAANEAGLSLNEAFADTPIDINATEQEKFVDDNYQEVAADAFELTDPGYDPVADYMTPEQRQNEIDEERIATMVEDGGMSVEEATFRVKTQREPTELDKALGYDFIQYQTGEALTERENGYKIADDNETVQTVVIPDDALPEFKTRADLRNWLIGKFNEIGNVTIKSTGANVEFNKTGAQRAIKNARQKKNNIAYPEIEKVVSGAKYSGFREADERHQNVKGQDVYHSGVVYKGVPYSVEFYVDVPLSGNTGDNFAGNKIREIKIAPTETRVTSENQNRPANNLSDAISNVSLAVLRGKVNPARYDNLSNTFYQKGKKAIGRRVYSVFDLKVGDHTAIGDVQEIDNENRTIKINDRLYSMLLLDSQIQYKGLVVNDAPVENAEENVFETEQVEKVKKAEENRPAVEEQKRNNREYNWKAKDYFGITNNLDVGGYILTDGDVLDLSGRKFGGDGRSRSIDHREISDAFEDYSVSMEDFINSGNIRYMPESNSILMSDVPTAEQYKIIEKIINRADGEVRVELMNDANNWGSYKDFSREYPAGTTLTKIKRDINAFYRGVGVRDIMQFFQTGRTTAQKTRMIYQVMGQYEPTKKLITLFKGRDKTTLTHELLHHYLPIYLTTLEKAKRFDKLEGLYKELGVDSYNELAASREKIEKLVDMGTSYIFNNEAPNEASKGIFEAAKQWMMDAYNTVKRFIKPSPEVTKFFDELFAREDAQMPDISDLKGKTAELAKILEGARTGQELTVNGLSLRDIANLRKALYARIPAAGMSLADDIREAGGIDTESEIAKQLGYDSRKGTETGFWNYKGGIKNEQQLLDFLKENGYLEEISGADYEDTAAIWNKAEDLINNRNAVFNNKNRERQGRREQALLAQQTASQLLNEHYIGDVKKLEEDLRSATKLLADKGAVAVDKLTLEYLARSAQKLEEKYKKLLYQKKEEGYNFRNQLNSFIDDMPLDFKHKSWLKSLIKNVSDEKGFDRTLEVVKERAERYIDNEAKRLYNNIIQDEVKSSRPRKAMAQKYDYENNVLFKDLREWNKLNQSDALAELEKYSKKVDEDGYIPTRVELLKRMFLEYKANGMSSSAELMKQLKEGIEEAKQLGIAAKNEDEFEKAFNREKERENVISILDKSTADKNSLKTKFVNVYRRGVTNLYSMLNSIAGKEIADKYEMETVFDRKEQKEWKHLKQTAKKAQKIYKVGSYGDLLNVMADKGEMVAKLYQREKADPGVESYDQNMSYELSILDIIDIYNATKNKKTAEDYYNYYGAEQVNRLLSMLTQEDREFGDMLMEDVNSRFKDLNEVYVRIYGMDLKKVDNYWMGSAKHDRKIDIYDDFKLQATTPGFFKERTAASVRPVAQNAWTKYQRHIVQSYYMTEIAEKYRNLASVFNSDRIQTRITNHFGEGVYKTLEKQIQNLGLNAQTPALDDVSGYFQKLLNNWVGAKVSVNPIVFVGQLTSFTNYAEGVNLSAFIKNIGYALAHPIEVKDFMMKYNGDFLRHRYEAGFNEAMSRFIESAKDTSGKKFGLSAKAKFNYSNALSSFVRIGDLGAIIYGGYGQFKTLLDSGMSVEEARRKFEFSTLRSQQSGNAASISDWQQRRGIARLYLAFKNTSLQYTRKIVDTVIMSQNGDISRAEAAKVLANYLLIQPAFWVIAKNIAKSLLGLGDDDDEFDDGVLEQLLANPVDGVPFVSDMVRYAYREAAGEKNYSLFSTPLLDDVEKSFRKIGKDDKDFYDFADIVTPFIEMLTSAPAGTAKRYMKIYNEKWGE